MKKRQRATKRMVPFPSIPETILEEEGEEEEIDEEGTNEEEEVPLQRRTKLARAIEEERRRSVLGTSPSTPTRPLEVSSSEEKVQQWGDEKSQEGDEIFRMSDFDFMPVGTILVGGKIVNIHTCESQQDDWTQMLLDL